MRLVVRAFAMAVHFIHTGDWHIGKPFGQFDTEKAPQLRAARTSIVDRVAALARETGARTVLVAGDIFDRPMIADDVLRRLAARLEDAADLTWYLLPGNHDPATANGVWHRFARIVSSLTVREHINILHEAGVWTLAPGVDLLAAPLSARAIAHDPTAWMDERKSAPDAIRIGLAHGAVQGFGSAGDAAVLIAPDRAVQAELDYLALGDWHGVREVGPKAWYAGTPEPDQFPENEPGFALSVRVERKGVAPIVQRHWLGEYVWQRHVLRGDLFGGIEGVEQALAGSHTEPQRTLLRVQVEGRVTLAEELDLRGRVSRLEDRAFHVDADFSGLRTDDPAAAADALNDPLLAAVGARLAERITGEGDDAAIAHEALLMLAMYARDCDIAGNGAEAGAGHSKSARQQDGLQAAGEGGN